MQYRDSDLDRFWSKVTRLGPDDCWPWKAGAVKEYGVFWLAGRNVFAHRFAWVTANGEIPERDDYHGTVIRRMCNNPRCCNPKHLASGTVVDNNQDCVNAGRTAKGLKNGKYTVPESAPTGERNGQVKLTAKQVYEIRRLYVGGGYRQLDLAGRFGVSRQLIGHITRNEAWKHLE